MAKRTYEYAESTSQSNTTQTSYQDKTTLTFTPDANSSYLILASAQFSSSNSAYDAYVRLRRTTGTATTFNEINDEPASSETYIFGGGFVESFGASPSSTTYKIQYHTSTGGTAYIEEARIFAIKLTSDDKSAESTSRSTTTSTSYQTKTTLTFTPGSTGDYLIIGVADVDYENATGDGIDVLIDIDDTTTATNANEIHVWNTGHVVTYAGISKENLDNTSHDIKMKYRSSYSGETSGIANARLIALRLDDFDDSYYGENDSTGTTQNTSYVDRTTVTDTPSNKDHLLIWAGVLSGDDTGVLFYHRGVLDGTQMGELITYQADTVAHSAPAFYIDQADLAASSQTWKDQWHSGNGTVDAWIDYSKVAVLNVEGNAVSYSKANTVKASVQHTTLQTDEIDISFGGAVEYTKANSAKANIIWEDQANANTVKANILVLTTKANSVIANIESAGQQPNSVRGNILTTYTKNNTAIGLIFITYTNANTSIANIKATYTQDNTAVANIKTSYTSANNAVSNILAEYTQVNTVIGYITNKVYSREVRVSLPTDDANLATLYSDSDISDVATDDATRVELEGSGYLIHLYKNHNTNDSAEISFTWNGQGIVAPTTSTVYLQVYNYNSTTWETVDSDSTTGADTDFDLTSSITENVSNYYSADNWTAFRTYQNV